MLRQARARLEAGQAEEAHGLYTRLLELRPGHNILVLGKARAAAMMGRNAEAAADYAALIEKFPDEPVLRREAARVELALGNVPEAERLSEIPPPTDVRAGDISRYLSPRQWPLDHRPRPDTGPRPRTLFTGRLRTGIMYDSNANQGPAAEMFQLGNWLIVFPDSGKKDTLAGYVGSNLYFQHRLSETGPWSFVADAGLFARGNANPDLADTKSREWQWGRLAAGFRYTAGNNLFEARLKGEVFDYQFTNSVLTGGLELTYLRALNKNVHLITQAAGEWRDYKRNHHLNGFYRQAGQYVRFFLGESRHSLLVGGRYLGGSAERRDSRYDGWEATARFTYAATPKFDISPHVGFTQERYRGPATFLEIAKRRDDRLRAGLDLVYRINDSWSLEGSYQYVRNDSKSKFYKYDQHVVSAGVSWGF